MFKKALSKSFKFSILYEGGLSDIPHPYNNDESFYPSCDVRFKNILLDKLPGTSRKVEYHVEELDVFFCFFLGGGV